MTKGPMPTETSKAKLPRDQWAEFEAVACVACGIVRWIQFANKSEEVVGRCGDCGAKNFYQRPIYLDEFLSIPLPDEWITVCVADIQAAVEHNRLVDERRAPCPKSETKSSFTAQPA